MRIPAFILLLSVLVYGKSDAQTTDKGIPLNEFSFESIFGSRKNDEENGYCLLGTGFFRTPRSKNSDSLIVDWMKKYPDARVVSVCSFGPTMADKPDSKQTYCWVINGTDTLNNYLIRNGCFPGGTMLRPRTYSEMGKREADLFKTDKNAHDVTVYISDKAYKDFINQIRAAEEYARKEKLGVWNERMEK